MKKILIIEDDANIQEIYHAALGKEGFDVIQVSTVKEGLEQAKTHHPNAVLLDIMLPGGMNGFDFLEQMRLDPTIQNTPVIVLTNLDSEGKIAQNLGVKDYFVKSNVNIERVIDAVKNLVQ